MPHPKKTKNPPGKPKTYSNQTFLDVLTDTSQTTQQVREALKQKEGSENISYNTVLTSLKRLADDGLVTHEELPAGSGSGKMHLWRFV